MASGREDYHPDVGVLTQRAVTMLQREAAQQPLQGAFSGGKDSIVIKRLAELAEVPVEWHYHVTTIDPPELLRYIKQHHPDVIWDRPKVGFFKRMQQRVFPSRRIRWCCQEYKERAPAAGSAQVIGVRIAESPRRKEQWTNCTMPARSGQYKYILPIRLWSDANIWEFIRWQKIPYCGLYDEGFTRLGCIGCPLAGAKARAREWKRWPRFKLAWQAAFRGLWDLKAGTMQRDGREWFGSARFASADELFEWWDAGGRDIDAWRRQRDAKAAQGVLFGREG